MRTLPDRNWLWIFALECSQDLLVMPGCAQMLHPVRNRCAFLPCFIECSLLSNHLAGKSAEHDPIGLGQAETVSALRAEILLNWPVLLLIYHVGWWCF
jgi:hypothetical protein